MKKYTRTVAFPYKGDTFHAVITRDERQQPWKIYDILDPERESIFQALDVLSPHDCETIQEIMILFTDNYMPV